MLKAGVWVKARIRIRHQLGLVMLLGVCLIMMPQLGLLIIRGLA